MSQSLEQILMIVVTVIMVIIAAVSLTGIMQSNSDKAAEKARTSLGAKVSYDLVEQGVLQKYVNGDEVTVDLHFTHLKNVLPETYLKVSVVDGGQFKWQVAEVDHGNVTYNTGLPSTDFAEQLKTIDSGITSVSSDLSFKIVFKATDTPTQDDEFVFAVGLGDGPTYKVTVDAKV